MRKAGLITLIFLLSITALTMVKAQENGVSEDISELFGDIQLFSDSISLIRAEYVRQVDMKDLVYGAVSGMMSKLDKYSKFLTPEEFRDITEETKGEFGGIGVEIGIRKGVLTVLGVMDNTPAERAGIKDGDLIVNIDGESTKDLGLEDSVQKMRGERGEKLNLKVYRPDKEELIPVEIKRDIIQVESIEEARIIEEEIGYLRISEFQERTARDLKRTIKGLRKDGAGSIILDLRNNPGGLLESAVDVADLFLNDGALVVYTEGRDKQDRTDFRSSQAPSFEELDIVVLINQASASAAEILAGALRDNHMALLVGETTYGKGSVQTVIPLVDGSGLRLTTAAYYTPSGDNLMDKGIEPDVRVKVYRKLASEKEHKRDFRDIIFSKVENIEKTDSRDDPGQNKTGEKNRSVDLQLEAAVDILKGAKIFCKYKFEKIKE
jgi:carboxyl-terminal processing protease